LKSNFPNLSRVAPGSLLFYILFAFLAFLASLAVDKLYCVDGTWREGGVMCGVNPAMTTIVWLMR
jgi:hypothetical protein